MARSSASPTSVKTLTGIKTPMNGSATAINTAINGRVISKPYNKYGWFLDSEEAEYEEERIPEYKLNRREMKWLEMTKDDRKWNKFVVRRFEQVRSRCRKGIPHSVRGRAWFYLCGGHKCLKRDPEGFDRLCKMEGDAVVLEDITKDLHRQFPSHFLFSNQDLDANIDTRPASVVSNRSSSHRDVTSSRHTFVTDNGTHVSSGQESLYKLLKAYSILKPNIGYCQGQGPIASTLLMVMPLEHAFWSFLSLNDLYLVGYYESGLEAIHLHGDMLMAFIKKYFNSVYKILKKHSIEPTLFMTDWFMCLYTRTLPWPMVLRIWDMFMCEGIIVIFKVAIVLVGTVVGGERKKCKDLYSTLEVLKRIPSKYLVKVKQNGVLNRDAKDVASGNRSKTMIQAKDHYTYPLLDKVVKLDLNEHDLKREHTIQANERRIKKKQQEDARKELASKNQTSFDDTTDANTSNGVSNGAINKTPTSNGTPGYNKYGTLNGRPSSALSRSSHKHRRAPFIEFEFNLGGKVLTNKPEYKPTSTSSVVTNGHHFTDGPSTPRTIERSSFRKSTSRSTSASKERSSKERSPSIERSKRSGSTRSNRRSHHDGREQSVSPRKERIKAEGSPLRTRKERHHRDANHDERSHAEQTTLYHHTPNGVTHQRVESRHSNTTVIAVNEPTPNLSVGQYNRSSSRGQHQVASRSDRNQHFNDNDVNEVIETRRGSSSAQQRDANNHHTHYIRDSKEGVPRQEIIDGVHDMTCKSPTKPSKEVIIPIKIEPKDNSHHADANHRDANLRDANNSRGYDENGRSRSKTSGYLPMTIDTSERPPSNHHHSASPSVASSFGNGRTSSVLDGRQVVNRTSTPLSSVASSSAYRGTPTQQVSRHKPLLASTSTPASKYTLVDHSKYEEKRFQEETIIFPKSNGFNRDATQRNGKVLQTRSEERQLDQTRQTESQRLRYEGSRTKFGQRDDDDANFVTPFRPFSRSVSGSNPYTGSTRNTLSRGGATGTGTKTTPNGTSRQHQSSSLVH